MTLSGLALLVLLSFFLVERFDMVASDREVTMVEHGLQWDIAEMERVVATQVDWDDAIASLDRKFDPNWADFNIGNYLYTFNGFSHAFVLDAAGQPIYASVHGERSPVAAYAPFAAIAAQLIPGIRAAEARRPPLTPRPGKNNILIPPIQTHAIARLGSQVYIVTATLVQPDFGKVLPKGAQAPITIAAKPIDAAMLKDFSGRYLIDGVHLAGAGAEHSGERHLTLKARDGQSVARIVWTPRQPGTMIREELRTPALLSLILLGLLALSVMRRGSAMVNDMIASEARAKHLAYHDVLTQLPNRAMLFERLWPILTDPGRNEKALAVMCVDLDRFKEVNDTLGHHAGDLLIEEVARRLRTVCGHASLIARQGGDEFVILHEQTSQVDAGLLAHAVLDEIRQPVMTEFGMIDVACSIGVAMIDRAGMDPSEVLRWADLALYESKELGRDQATFFEPEMDLALRSRQSLDADLRRALSDHSLTMVYQPQVDRSGAVKAVESLVRWTHPERGAIPPGVFVSLSEESGLILALGEYILRRVFHETRGWSQVRVAINVSPVQLRSPGFAAQVTRLAAEAGIDPSCYEIEVTETALLGEDPVAASNVEALKRLGFSIALDDFGTGYSSLSVLQRFPVDRIKIDRTFVSSLGGSPEAETLIDAMVKLARALGLAVIAEGVETETQLNQLLNCGCREFQGHFTGMPQDSRATAAILGLAVNEAEQVRLAG
ncbi:MAG: putative bifunctional diguanylate cyclase/phosphodiesterase [Novosphingobium sp.]